MSDRIWISVKDRLPTEQDIKENNNDSNTQDGNTKVFGDCN